jgi:hypothetical protein
MGSLSVRYGLFARADGSPPTVRKNVDFSRDRGRLNLTTDGCQSGPRRYGRSLAREDTANRPAPRSTILPGGGYG